MLKLPNVTLVSVETRCHELAKRTLDDALRQIEFGEVLIFTDDPVRLNIAGAITTQVPNWPTKDGYMRFFQFESCNNVKTDYVLFIEWDAGICDVSMWSDRFLEFDYLGAPWWYSDSKGQPIDGPENVGNGGFSLRSMRLQRFMKDNQRKYPAISDNMMCRDFGHRIIVEGNFKWATVAVANDFAMEGFDRLGLRNDLKHFGYHSVCNWPLILSRDELILRYNLMKANAYVTGYGRTAELGRLCPWLEEERGQLAS